MLAHINKATEPQRHSGVASSTYAVRQLASLRAFVPPWLHLSSIAEARAAGTIFIALCAALIAAVPARAEILERVLAVVGTEMITLTDVTAARDFGLVVVPPGSEDTDPRGADAVDRSRADARRGRSLRAARTERRRDR